MILNLWCNLFLDQICQGFIYLLIFSKNQIDFVDDVYYLAVLNNIIVGFFHFFKIFFLPLILDLIGSFLEFHQENTHLLPSIAHWALASLLIRAWALLVPCVLIMTHDRAQMCVVTQGHAVFHHLEVRVFGFKQLPYSQNGQKPSISVILKLLEIDIYKP